MRTQVYATVIIILAVIVTAHAGSQEQDQHQPLVVHEWGTFTVLQDDAGNAVDGVNINEESLPEFVHTLAPDLAPDSHELGPLIGTARSFRSKGITRYYHAARMRMETPIIYLYPPKDQPAQPVTLNVDFKGGWITEWYPRAEVVAPGYKDRQARVMMNLTPSTTGSITWNDVKVTDEAEVRQTASPVWLAPWKTAAPIVSAGGEAENYLFYRGVANLEAPLRVTRDNDVLSIKTNRNSTCPIKDYQNLDMWLVEVSPQGELQFRRVSSDQQSADEALATTAATFDDTPGEGLPMLRKEMLAALVDRGLFDDEAEAMLNTWEASYFRTPGLRLFFTLPQSWTDRVLPLQVSGYEKTEIVRAMIGRIELISARQRKLLAQIAQGPISDQSWFLKWHQANLPDSQSTVYELAEGRKTLEEVGLQPPADYRAYMELGRFRDALIRHEIAHPAEQVSKQGHVSVNGTLVQIRHPAIADGEVDSFTISLPGENRIINLGEMEIYSGGTNVTSQAKLSQSSTYQGRFPIENLVDGDKNCISHTNFEKNPWIKVEFDSPLPIDEVKIWNRGDFEGRFDGAEVAFFDGKNNLASVEVRTVDTVNLRTFANNYRLPRR